MRFFWRRLKVRERRANRVDPRPDGGAGADGETVAVRRRGEEPRVLVGVHHEPCLHCGTGNRTVSTWSTVNGTSEEISWCPRCFNARCDRAELSPREWGALATARAALGGQGSVRYFDCARHAVDYVEALGSRTEYNPGSERPGLV